MRRGDELARRRQELPWLRSTRRIGSRPTRERLAGGPLPGALAAPRLSIHVRLWSPAHRRAPGMHRMLLSRRSLRRCHLSHLNGRRHHPRLCVDRPAAGARGLQAANGLAIPGLRFTPPRGRSGERPTSLRGEAEEEGEGRRVSPVRTAHPTNPTPPRGVGRAGEGPYPRPDPAGGGRGAGAPPGGGGAPPRENARLGQFDPWGGVLRGVGGGGGAR